MDKQELLNTYTDQDRTDDFHWFVSIYDDLYKQYGHKWFAIRHKKILGVYDSFKDSFVILSDYPEGSFIVQKCNGDESGYTGDIGME